MSSTRSMTREIGTAFAVLAIYLLTVLAPLHQARAGQLAFEQLGYTTLDSAWILCTPAGLDDEDRGVSVAKCPATGIGKHEMVAPAAVAMPARSVLAAAPAPGPRGLMARPAATPPTGVRGPPGPV